jgi:DNA-binding transcriptional regulator LsrR (DeoR family)
MPRKTLRASGMGQSSLVTLVCSLINVFIIMERPKKNRRLLAIAAARLYSEGKLQTEIAPLIKVSQPDVSRLLREAQNKLGILRVRPSLIKENISPSDWRTVEYEFFSDKELTEKLNTWVPAGTKCNVRVLGTSEDDFFTGAARKLLELLAKSKAAGVLWGRTIRQIVDRLPSLIPAETVNATIECVPLCGDPIYVMNQDDENFSASHLAAELERLLTGATRRTLPSMSGVPAYLPRSVLNPKVKRKSTILEDFIYKVPGYQKIFRDPGGSPFIDRVDTLLTGVGICLKAAGSDERECGAFLRERMTQEDLKPAELSELVVGDIGGILVQRTGISAAKKKIVAELNAGWLGVNEGQMRRIARRSARSGSAGVIAVARGSLKGEIISQCIKEGLVNELIIDFPLAMELKNLR